MDLLPTPEQDEIVGSIRAVLADRHVLGQPMTDELWATAAEQGWFGLGIAEADGGVGYSLVEESLLCIELGRACVPGPFLGTIIAAAADDPDLRHQVMAGERPVGIAERENDHLRVLDGRSGGLAVVLDEMAVVELGSLESQPSFDQLVEVAVAPDWTPLTSAGNRDRAALLIAGALAGLAAATMAQSVSYGMDREQFGQPVGGFQAVKHRCALRRALPGEWAHRRPIPDRGRCGGGSSGRDRQRRDQRAEPRRHRLHARAHCTSLRHACTRVVGPRWRSPLAPRRGPRGPDLTAPRPHSFRPLEAQAEIRV